MAMGSKTQIPSITPKNIQTLGVHWNSIVGNSKRRYSSLVVEFILMTVKAYVHSLLFYKCLSPDIMGESISKKVRRLSDELV